MPYIRVTNKKDYNYIAAVEKAIAEKYGKEAVQDFRSTWDQEKEKQYLRQLKNAKNEQKNLTTAEVIDSDSHTTRKKKKAKTSDRLCPVCKTYSFSMKDDLYMNRFSCCFRCYIDFVEDREDRWKDEERPDKQQIEAALRRRN